MTNEELSALSSKSGRVVILCAVWCLLTLIVKQVQQSVTVRLYREGNDEDGEPLCDIEFTGVCNYQDSAKTVLTPDKRLTEITGQAFFIGDIAPGQAVINDGEAVIFGERRRIAQGMKARNPDGSVNYTRIDLI